MESRGTDACGGELTMQTLRSALSSQCCSTIYTLQKLILDNSVFMDPPRVASHDAHVTVG